LLMYILLLLNKIFYYFILEGLMPPKKINPKYVPKSLTPEEKKKQIKSIKEGTIRPKIY